ncbi:CBASS cGAMP-activated phospholipase [Microvirga calopogonii]|uniref:CBASS cGAMP-activated phospholipase n=1 Tax=Microvirga calopogonii TaxID=2078013 RepID=UPI000E0D3B41|nr:CBASS cGAMP-activated phospholipase [Microvirga calopogonii]
MPDPKPFRVLSLDGGGMRGTYTAAYLAKISETFARRRGLDGIDVGGAFDLIVGTSTGGIIACALAAGVPLRDLVTLYRKYGPSIFPRQLPEGLGIGLVQDIRKRPQDIAAGTEALRKALHERLGDVRIGDVWQERKIALAITAVEMSQHRSWVFKTPHLPNSSHRDDRYKLVDVCLATSAAPVYRSLALLPHPDGPTVDGYNVFVDGGLWANNPVLVGLIDALEMTEPGQEIQILCMGTCPRPAGEQIAQDELHRGLPDWKFGGLAASLSVDAQEFAYDNMARMLAKHFDRRCEIIRFPGDKVPAALVPHLELDNTTKAAFDALINQARTDADMTNSKCGDPTSREGRIICSVFDDAPAMAKRPMSNLPVTLQRDAS